jgi:ABC-type polysaccharide/polyol phosphate export permease
MKHLQLIRLLVGRELTLRYKRSVIGIGWTLLNPMLTSFVLWVVFSFVFSGRLPDGQQYAPYLMAGILFNIFLNQGILVSAESIAANTGILTKVKVVPQVFPLSAAMAGLINFFIGLIPLTIVVYVSGQSVAGTFLLVVVVGLCLAFFVAGIGLILSITFIRFDDARNIVSVVLMLLTYLTPVFYPVSALSPRLQKIINLNPLTSYLDCYRWAFSNNSIATGKDWIFMITTALLSFLIGTYVFKKFWTRTVALL